MQKIVTFCVLATIIGLGTLEYLTVGLPDLSAHTLNLAFCGFIVCVSVVLAMMLRHSKKDLLISLSGGAMLTVLLVLALQVRAFVPIILDQCEQNANFILVVFLSILYFPCVYAGTLYLYIKYYSGLKRDIDLIN